jgi:limonene-1,2-epoxide hydrolase
VPAPCTEIDSGLGPKAPVGPRTVGSSAASGRAEPEPGSALPAGSPDRTGPPIRHRSERGTSISGVGGTPSAEDVVRDFMAAFSAAWPTGDAATLSRFFSEDAQYCNGPREPVNGREAIVADLARMMSLGGEVDADVRHLLSDGAVVMTERVDYVRLGARTAALRIAGVV